MKPTRSVFLAACALGMVFIASCSVNPAAPTTVTATNIYTYSNHWDPWIRSTTTAPYFYVVSLMDASGNPLVEMNNLSVYTTSYVSVTQGNYLLGYRFFSNVSTATPWMSNPAPVTLTNQTAYSIVMTTTATNNTDFFLNEPKTLISLKREGSINNQGVIY